MQIAQFAYLEYVCVCSYITYKATVRQKFFFYIPDTSVYFGEGTDIQLQEKTQYN